MSSHPMNRSAWISPTWLWILLAICLIGWRVGSRVDQYHPLVAGPAHQAQVAFFDANERNLAAVDASRSLPRLVAEHTDLLLPMPDVKPPVQPAYERQGEARTVLPPIYVDSVSLFSNPPPAASLS